jgi:tetratricopeptide (TPR) repeat protein
MSPSRDSTATKAATAYAQGDYEKAAKLLSSLPETPDNLRQLGMARLRAGDRRAALRLLARAATAAPDNPLCALHYGLALQEDGQFQAACAEYRRATKRDPLDPAPWINLSTSLLALNDTQGAITAARHGRLRAPKLAAAHYTLGNAYLAAGQVAAAGSAFRAATRLAPDFADAWVNTGVAAYRGGDIYAAKAAMRQALRVAPLHYAAAANLGSFMRLTGEVEAGEALLMQMVQNFPNAFAARVNLAAEYLQEDRATEALALLEGDVPPEMVQHVGLQRALAFIKLGRLPEALELIDSLGPVPAALEPLKQWRLVLAYSAQGRAEEAQTAAAAMAEALKSPAILPEHRIMAHYDLAKFFSQTNNATLAFVHWQAGHDLLAKIQPFSRTAHKAFVDTTIEVFSAERFAAARAQNNDETPVFVVGMPRSGTTLTEQILAAHAQVFGAGERAALAQTFYNLGQGQDAAAASRIAALDENTLTAGADSYLAELHALDPQAARIVDKMPGNFLFLGLVGLLMPGARIISCLRDPRDIGMSIFTFRFYGTHPYAHNLSDLGWYMGEKQRLMDHWKKVLPNPILEVNLSDWVDDFPGTLTRMLDFLGLPYDAACEAFHEVDRRVRTVSRAQVREKVNARGLGRWKQYAEQLQPLVTALEAAGVV